MDDLISRSEALEAINQHSYETSYDWEKTQDILNELPAVDAVPAVHARWILKHIGVGHYWECSACHTNPCIYVTENTKYCPNCGARMDAEEEK